MIEPITAFIKVTINLCKWENSFPEEFSENEPNLIYSYCDFKAIWKKTLEQAKEISNQPFKFSKEECDRMTKSILDRLND